MPDAMREVEATGIQRPKGLSEGKRSTTTVAMPARTLPDAPDPPAGPSASTGPEVPLAAARRGVTCGYALGLMCASLILSRLDMTPADVLAQRGHLPSSVTVHDPAGDNLRDIAVNVLLFGPLDPAIPLAS